ncbi:Atu4866 domain-containing protein [Chitinophaga sp. S165]|uniref:Atu4866 domain-containing protein n=1 Tax=Chitinophaga sp. S165 TaxID=2135462 RepID=UPI000D898367|nr:Atu4866 domain-containing protein [Chitinophaga sp. S165]PWV48876.1 putative ligand-binding protein with streptavidin-like fold [Chitinophaga sp. S165]
MGNIEEKEVSCFDILRLEDIVQPGWMHDKYNQDDFYKIALIKGAVVTLIFFNPKIPYTWEDEQTGFLCIFKGTFFSQKMKDKINKLPMFRTGKDPVYMLTGKQDIIVSGIFSRMREELSSDYLYKYDLLRNYVTELIHFALKKTGTMENNDKYIGMWVTADGYIRHELLPGGRYDEARGNRKSAYQGSYKLTGDHIDYKDDTGFTADGDFRDGVLYHAGMVLYREEKKL